MSAAIHSVPYDPGLPVPRQLSVLVATPNEGIRKSLREKLRGVARLEEAATGAEALERLGRHGARLVILDRNFPDLNSDELIGVIEQQFPGTEVLPLDSLTGAIEFPPELGDDPAFRWLQEMEAPKAAKTEVETCAPAAAAMMLPGVIGTSAGLREVASLVRSVTRHRTAVLITGETGAGKELVAEAVHKLSPRSDKPFITVNCAAIPETLIEAELFGHTRGAFTGADRSRLGKIHAAQGGTIFFDEIGELPLGSQSKLLRFLESGEVQRLGTSDVFRLDVRVIAATNVDLEKRVAEGRFREDLFYRLSVFPLELPPLRERLEDIPLLARYFLQRFAGEQPVLFSAEAIQKLSAHHWPGNIRELRNVVERAFVLACESGEVRPEHLLIRKPCASAHRGSESS
ncbi:MAG: sigma-54 dependent transcriptional regulator [Acidobacteriota bacterium]|nr:sigma-54 dependent transcriptional regulator [Acidobacteriota bacterium]